MANPPRVLLGPLAKVQPAEQLPKHGQTRPASSSTSLGFETWGLARQDGLSSNWRRAEKVSGCKKVRALRSTSLGPNRP